MMRLGLFLATNMAVLFVLGIIINVLGLNQPGMSWWPMLIVAGIMGMAGSFISLMMSKSMAKRSAGAVVIESPSNAIEKWLVETVYRQADKAGIGRPEVAIFNSDAPNAFATGANKNAALVAVSTGLLNTMDKDEVEAVLGHEVSHVANGDMVTLSLLQGVLNTFVIVFAQIISSIIDRRMNDGQSQSSFGRGIGYQMTYMVAQVVLGFIATLIVRAFSRYREYRADEGGARLASPDKMIRALKRLQNVSKPAELPASMQAFGINGGLLRSMGLQKLIMTHPPLEERIAALEKLPFSG